MKTNRLPRRYAVYDYDGSVELFLSAGYGEFGDEGVETTHIFEISEEGYIVEKVRSGFMGHIEEDRIVTGTLFGEEGTPLMVTSPSLAVKVRHLVSKHCSQREEGHG